MLPLSVLNKLRSGVSAASIALVLSGTGVLGKEALTPKEAATLQQSLPLTPEQVAEVNRLIPDLTSQDRKFYDTAFQGIFKMGKGAIEPLTQTMNATTNQALKHRIAYLIRYINAGGDPCPTCGMG